MQELRFFKDYLIARYGQALYRIPVALPLGCPNRENNFGRGCVYCAEDGNRARHLSYKPDLAGQVRAGIDFVSRRYGAKPPYIAYFQSFTNTYGPAEKLRRLYAEVLKQADFRMVIIGTRPDCINTEVVELLREIAASYELWVELGVQTSNDATLKLIRRGHNFAAVERAVRQLAAAGLAAAAHVILGLPGETTADYRRTARDLAALPFRAVKLHNLLVLKNTFLAEMFAAKDSAPPVRPLNEYEYAAAAAEFLRRLPDDWLIMRLNTDAPAAALIAPKWRMKKGQFLDFFREYYAAGNREAIFPRVKTGDGSSTLYHPGYRQHFHTLAGARSEAEKKFIEPLQLRQLLLERDCTRLLDVGFGLGYNAAAAAAAAETAGAGKLRIIALENEVQVLSAARPLAEPDRVHRAIMAALAERGSWRGEFAELELRIGDARRTLPGPDEKFDGIFLDGFSPEVNPELWTYDFIRELSRRLSENGRLITYSSAYPVRGALLRCGLWVGETGAFGRKRGGTLAAWTKPGNGAGLPQKELNIVLKSTAGAAYRDPGLRHDAQVILDRKRQLTGRLRRRGIPKWYRPAASR
ncbi:MAG: TIGR01212 family radical SAM protein [Victivallaceae bacterium]|nr:TIGR01212 family radical SAM protein [Victivallaceae bacterium]